VFGLIANAIVLSVQSRVRDHAVLQTLGFSGGLIAQLIVAEGLVMGVVGGCLGAAGAYLMVSQGRFSLTMEGLNIEVASSPSILLTGLVISVLMGVVAGLVPAWQASRREIASCFRAV
jgi:putative ABC transport system permease protein